MKRGEVYDAALDPTRGSEQAGFRPVVVVSRDAINRASSVVIVIPCTTYREGRRVYPSQVRVEASEGGLETDSLALGEQARAVAKSPLRHRRGVPSPETLSALDRALLISQDLPTR